MTNRDEKRILYKDIESNLRMVAITRRVMMDTQGEDSSEIDKFIAEVGGREIERIEQMSRGEFMREMVKNILEGVVGE